MSMAVVAGAIKIAVPTIQAVIELGSMIQSSVALWKAGHLSDEQMLDIWRKAGINVQTADANLQAAMDEARSKIA